MDIDKGRKYNDIIVKQTVVRAKAGSTLDDCILDAVALAIERREDVVLTHSGTIYEIELNSIYLVAKEHEIPIKLPDLEDKE